MYSQILVICSYIVNMFVINLCIVNMFVICLYIVSILVCAGALCSCVSACSYNSLARQDFVLHNYCYVYY